MPEVIERAAAALGPRARRDVLLGPLTTYRVGGPAALFLEVTDEADLALAKRAVGESGVEVLVVGRGSNLLVADRGFPGLAVVLGEGFAAIEIDDTGLRGPNGVAGLRGPNGVTGLRGPNELTAVVAGGAVALPVLARRTAAAALTGLEWAVGVPGSVGGAVRMNAGGHGSDVSATLVAARVVDLTAGQRGPNAASGRLDGDVPAADLQLGYRRSALAATHVVVSARFALAAGDREASERQIGEIVRWRREHQPGGSNAGSVFANPPGDSAGRLIDEAGLKGHRVGSAFVSPRHANFVQVDDAGSADDVARLLDEVSRIVAERTGVHLELENRLVGFRGTG